jgi:hypothetical protein
MSLEVLSITAGVDTTNPIHVADVQPAKTTGYADGAAGGSRRDSGGGRVRRRVGHSRTFHRTLQARPLLHKALRGPAC